MKARINGQDIEVPCGLTIQKLAREKKLDPKGIVIELNREIVRPELWPSTVLKDNDHLEIISFVGGG